MQGQNEKQRRRGWMLVGVCAAITVSLGYYGFRRYFLAHGEDRPPLNLFYLALQLFTLESGSVPGRVPLSLDVARLAAPTIAAWAGIKVLFEIFREEFEAFRLRRFHDHVVICGLGDKALHYVQDFVKNFKVVVIERNAENDLIHSAHVMGAHVLVGDARFEKVLGRARVERARHLIAITGDDLANIEISEQARAMAKVQGSGRLDCHTHIVNPQLLEAVKVHERLFERTERFVPNVFSMYRDSARALFEARPLDWIPIARDSEYFVQLIIFGFGRMGENVLLQAARIGHFANRKPLRVSVVDRLADSKWQSFLFRHPSVNRVCDIKLLNLDAEDPGVIEEVQRLSSDKHAVVSAVICFNSDERSLAYAVGITEKLGNVAFPVTVRMPQESLLCKVFGEGRPSQWGTPHTLAGFGTCGQCCTSERLLGEARDAMAKLIHEHHRNRVDPEMREKDPAYREWETLREDFRESSRQQADHIPVKLRAVGFGWRHYGQDEARNSHDFDITEKEIETLAIMEHNRWNAERWLAGWRQGPKDKARKITPYLVEWEDPDLPDYAKKWDSDFVRDIPLLVKVWRIEKNQRESTYANQG